MNIFRQNRSYAGPIALATCISALVYAVGRLLRGRYSFRDKVVVITGGSRGLGLAMARRFAAEGAHLALVARSRVELERAHSDLTSRGDGGLLLLPYDIRDEVQVKRAIEDVVNRFGRVDVLVNNAGEITVGPLETMTREDWTDAMELHFWASHYMVEAVLPHIPRAGGRIVNVSSFGGKIAVPHMAPYCASKFALVGYSDAIRAELANSGVKVTTVCPGLLRTGSHLNAIFKGDYRKEFAWFSSGAGSPFNAKHAGRAARGIVEACREGRPELVITLQARLAVVAQALMPNLFARGIALVNRFMPRSAADGEARKRHMGWESRPDDLSKLMTRLADKANADLNGRRGHFLS